MRKVLIIYHYFALYRLPILKELVKQEKEGVKYYYMSGLTTDKKIKIIDPSQGKNKNQMICLPWRQINNTWLTKRLLWQGEVIKEAFQRNFDVYIFLGIPYHISTWISMILLKTSGKKVLLWTHGKINGNFLKKLIKICFYKIPDALLLYGSLYINDLKKAGINKNKLYIIYNSLDYYKQLKIRCQITDIMIEKAKKKLFENSNLPIILFIGRLTKRKKLKKLLNACFELKRKNFEVNVLIIGEGEEKENLVKLSKSLKIDKNICFYGECYEENEIAILIKLSDVCVSPGDIGLTSIHCLVYGTPVITHNNKHKQMPEYESIIEGKTGALYEYGNNESLVEVILTWLNTKKKKKVQKYCYEVIDKYYNSRYQASIINIAVKTDS